MNADVYVVQTTPSYPEFPYDQRDNIVEVALCDLFRLWNRDPVNPFAGWVKPGGRVLLKPNWVLHRNRLGYDLDSLVTHSSVLAGLIRRAARAIEGEGRIVVADAPLQGCNFASLMRQSRLLDLIERFRGEFRGIEFIVEDWRLTTKSASESDPAWGAKAPQERRCDYAIVKERDYRVVDRATDSMLEDIAEFADRFRVTQYNPSLMNAHHSPGKHEFLVAERVFQSDLIINVPKLKTHIKAGLTGALKNLVGINGHKEYLPHHIKGSHAEGGDCYDRPSFLRRWYDKLYDNYWERYPQLSRWKREAMHVFLAVLWRCSKVVTMDGIDSGSWAHNETIWRTTLDLNHILYFSKDSASKIITVMDGIVSGEGEGPLVPSPKPVGLLIAGENPAYVDATVAHLMGYNISRIPTVYNAIYHRKSRFAGPALESVDVIAQLEGRSGRPIPIRQLPNLDFLKPRYWRRASNPRPSVSHTDPVRPVVPVGCQTAIHTVFVNGVDSQDCRCD